MTLNAIVFLRGQYGVTKMSDSAQQQPPTDNTSPVSPKASKSLAMEILGIAAVGFIIWFYFMGGIEQKTDSDMQNIKDKVASDSVAQYRIAERNGTAMDRCVQAGMVTAAFLQAKDEDDYRQWKAIEAKDCRAAGVSQ